MSTFQTCPKIPNVQRQDWGGKRDRRNYRFGWIHALAAPRVDKLRQGAWEEARARYETRRRVRAVFDWFAGEPARDSTLATLFRREVDAWKTATAPMSSVAKMVAQPNYLRIIGLNRY